MNFTQTIVDDDFARADTTAGTGNNSTTVGSGWLDLRGNVYRIKAAAGGLFHGPPTGAVGIEVPIYQSASASVVNGKARIYTTAARDHASGAVFRVFRFSGGVRGYFAGVASNNRVLFSRMSRGDEKVILNESIRGFNVPANFVFDVTCEQAVRRETRLTVTIYDPADLTKPLATRSVTDEEPTLQNRAGIMGVTSDGRGLVASRVILYGE